MMTALLLVAAAPELVFVDEPTPLVAVVVTPPGAASAAGTTQILEALSRSTAARTDLEIRSPEQAGMSAESFLACPTEERFSCFARLAWATPGERLLLVLGVLPLGRGVDRITATLLDPQNARRIAEARREDIEDAVFGAAFHAPAESVKTGDARALTTWAEALVEKFAAAFEKLGHGSPPGRVLLEHACPGCAIAVDGRTISVLPSGPIELARVRPGRRSIELVREGAVAMRCGIEVPPNAAISATPATCEVIAPPARITPIIGWSGVALGAAGAALVAFGIDRAARGPSAICVHRDDETGGSCPGLGLPGFGYDLDPSITTNPADGTVPIAAVGASLLAAGSAAAISTLFTDDESWWLPIVLGLGAGAAAGVATAAIGGF